MCSSDLAVSSRPSSVMSHVEPGKTSSPGQLSLHRREERICDDISIIAVGNKRDLKEERQVSFLEASRFAQEQGILFLETSALTGENVNVLFRSGLRIPPDYRWLHDPVSAAARWRGAVAWRTVTGASTRCTLLSSTSISRAFAHRALTSASLMYSHRRSCSI